MEDLPELSAAIRGLLYEVEACPLLDILPGEVLTMVFTQVFNQLDVGELSGLVVVCKSLAAPVCDALRISAVARGCPREFMPATEVSGGEMSHVLNLLSLERQWRMPRALISAGEHHSCAVAADDALLICGDEDIDAAGHMFNAGTARGMLGGLASPQPRLVRLPALAGKRVFSVSCGTHHTLLVDFDGNAYSFGGGEESGPYCLGHGDEAQCEQARTVPTIIAALRRRRCMAVAAGCDFSLVLDTHGRVYAFGDRGAHLGLGQDASRIEDDPNDERDEWTYDELGISSPKQIACPPMQAISAGARHSLFLSRKGYIFTCGSSNTGALGLGDTVEERHSPTPLMNFIQSWAGNDPVRESREAFQFCSIAAGRSHSVFFSTTGAIFVCGDGGNGPYGRRLLGVGATHRPPPTGSAPHNSTGHDEIMTLSAGGHIMSTQKAAGWHVLEPERVLGLDHLDVIAVSAGSSHRLALTKEGDVYSFGTLDGRLGRGRRPPVPPAPVQFPMQVQARAVAAGSTHSFILANNGQIYAFGRGVASCLFLEDDTSTPTAVGPPLSQEP